MPIFPSPIPNTGLQQVVINLLENLPYISIHFAVPPEEQDLVVAVLSPLPMHGFEQRPHELIAHISTDAFDGDLLNEQLAFLPNPPNYHIRYQEEKNWNAQWEADYQPVIIGNFCGIRASFHAVISTVQYELIVHPQMSFGTGHHETTQLMVQLMKEEDFQTMEVLDMGTGTGVLGILAYKMGAKQVLCMDVDLWCVENALENCALNQTTGVEVRLREKMWRPESGQYDRILANINRNVLLKDIPSYVEGLREGGAMLLSGFYTRDCSQLLTLLKQLGMNEVQRISKNDWTALRLHRK